MAPALSKPWPIGNTPTSDDLDADLRCRAAICGLVTHWLQRVEYIGEYDENAARRVAMQYITQNEDEFSKVFQQSPKWNQAQPKDRVTWVRSIVLRIWRDRHAQSVQVDSTKPRHVQIYDHMVQKAQLYGIDDGLAQKYKNLFENHSPEFIFGLLENRADAQIWQNAIITGKSTDPRYLENLKEDFLYQRRGWYAIFLWNKQTKMYEWYRAYVGQAGHTSDSHSTLARRGFRHVKNVTDPKAKALLYLTWRDFSDPIDEKVIKQSKIVRLGFAPEPSIFENPEDFELFMNIGEMFYALIFRTLQVWDLETWLPHSTEVDQDSAIALNVVLPLNQDDGNLNQNCWAKLVNSPDSKVAKYVYDKLMKSLSSVHNGDWVNNVTNQRKVSTLFLNKVFRSRDPGQVVRVKCSREGCGHEKDDKHTTWLVRTGEYVMRSTVCAGCQKRAAEAKAKGEKAPPENGPIFWPHGPDANLPKIAYSTVKKRVANHVEWSEYYTFQRDEEPGREPGMRRPEGRPSGRPYIRKAPFSNGTHPASSSKRKDAFAATDVVDRPSASKRTCVAGIEAAKPT